MTFGPEVLAVVYGLASALTWGAGDFSGGLATRRANPYIVVAISQGLGLLLLLALALLVGEPLPPQIDLMWGALAGLAGGIAVLLLYRALAVGQMGIAAPITAVLAAVGPVIFSAFTEGAPSELQLAGFVIAVLGVWLLSRPSGPLGKPEGIGLAVLSGLAIGAFLILLQQAGTTALFWPLVAARAASLLMMTALVLLNHRAGEFPRRRTFPLVLLTGAMDAAGNAFFVLAAQVGRLDVATVISSLYPASTILLAAVILKERVTRLQVVGIIAALAAIALIAAS
ncbi:MAG: DMT family transporter [Chloroflexota bacterium]|nr:DMT family transporter [Chloroflexota bacterium]MDQ5865035.1 DMT family transporter [Chloroflexota bacterium]